MRTRAEQANRTLILKRLEVVDATAYDLAKFLNINVRNVRPYLKLLHEQKLIHISYWEHPRNGPKVAVWGLGDHPNAPYPKIDPTQRAREYRARKRSLPAFLFL